MMLPEQKSKSVSFLLLPLILIYFAITNFYMSSQILLRNNKTNTFLISINIMLIASTFFLPKLIAKAIYKTKLYRKEAQTAAIVIGVIGSFIALTGTIPFDRKTGMEWAALYFNLLLVINLVQVHKYLKKHNHDALSA